MHTFHCEDTRPGFSEMEKLLIMGDWPTCDHNEAWCVGIVWPLAWPRAFTEHMRRRAAGAIWSWWPEIIWC